MISVSLEGNGRKRTFHSTFESSAKSTRTSTVHFVHKRTCILYARLCSIIYLSSTYNRFSMQDQNVLGDRTEETFLN